MSADREPLKRNTRKKFLAVEQMQVLYVKQKTYQNFLMSTKYEAVPPIFELLGLLHHGNVDSLNVYNDLEITRTF